MRQSLKFTAHALSTVFISPVLLLYLLGRPVLGRDRAFQNCAQILSLIPGMSGQFARRAFLCVALDRCARSVTVELGTLLSRPDARIGENVYVGAQCHLGWVEIGANTLLASGVHVPSGPETHGFADPDTPIREQPGSLRPVKIGENCWIGSGAIVLADVGRDTIVAAGSVVTKPLPAGVIAGGVPARVIRER